MLTTFHPRNWRSWRFHTKLGVLATLFLLAWSVFQLWPVWLVPGPKTTVITGPLRANGTVDYAAALNRECSEGVTPENNAAVLLIQALGPNVIDPRLQGAYFQELGIDSFPRDGEYLRPLDRFLPSDRGTSDRVFREMDQARRRPWDSAEFPELAKWLEANQHPLELCAAACQRERYFDPLVVLPGQSLQSIVCPLVQNSRNVSRLLGLRVTSHLKAGRIDDALSDAQSMHRLSRLVGQNPLLIPQLVAYAHEAMACQADSAIFNSGSLSAEQSRRQRLFLADLAPLSPMADIIDRGERYLTLDSLQQQFLGPMFTVGWMHPNALLETFNEGYDDLSTALRKPDWRDQRTALADVTTRIENKRKFEWATAGRVLLSPRRRIPTRSADVLLALLVPAVEQAASAAHRTRIQTQIAIVGYALAEYRAQHGIYPAALDALTPEFIAQIPRDPFADGPIRYLVDPEGGTALIYSLGENGVDEGGRMDGPTKADDIAFGAVPTAETP